MADRIRLDTLCRTLHEIMHNFTRENPGDFEALECRDLVRFLAAGNRLYRLHDDLIGLMLNLLPQLEVLQTQVMGLAELKLIIRNAEQAFNQFMLYNCEFTKKKNDLKLKRKDRIKRNLKF
uniref:NR LBD domain-containing protein n=1 Tax=Caenorhabditis tropicalis TaxID=1561998 RepID=A0A1I7URN8_9PELO